MRKSPCGRMARRVPASERLYYTRPVRRCKKCQLSRRAGPLQLFGDGPAGASAKLRISHCGADERIEERFEIANVAAALSLKKRRRPDGVPGAQHGADGPREADLASLVRARLLQE